MRIRYLSYLTLGVVAAFLVVATVAFDASTVVALAFGLGIAMLVVSAGLAVRYREDLPSLVIGGGIAVVSAWTILASAWCSRTAPSTTSHLPRRLLSARCPCSA